MSGEAKPAASSSKPTGRRRPQCSSCRATSCSRQAVPPIPAASTSAIVPLRMANPIPSRHRYQPCSRAVA